MNSNSCLNLPIYINGDINGINTEIKDICNKLNITISKLNNIIKIITPIDYLIYYENNQSTLNITLFMPHKKNKINISTNNDQLTTNVNIDEITQYNINLLAQGDFIISKKIKKNSLFMNLVYKNIFGSLYNLKNGIFIFIDNNGIMHFYNDVLQLNDFETLDQSNLINLSENMNENIKIESYILTESITPVCINNNTLYSKLSNVISNSLSYINPLNYLVSNKTIPNSSIDFYFNKDTLELYKKIDNKVKILKPNKLNIPILIDNITYNDNNVVFSGLIQPKFSSVKIIFNSFFITHQLVMN